MAATAKAATMPSAASTAPVTAMASLLLNHVSAILMKRQVTDRTAAAIKARDAR